MKFNDGYWLLREGVTIRYAVESFETSVTDRSISNVALTKPKVDRGSHLNTPTVTVDLDAPAEDIVHVRVRHHLGEPNVRFELWSDDGTAGAEVTTADDAVRLRSGRLSATIPTSGPWRLDLDVDGTPLTAAGSKSTGSVDVDGTEYMVQRLDLPVGASVYGLGERFTPFVKNGQVVDSWNEDGGTASEQAYKSIPFLLTDAGFGVFVNSPGRVSFEIASEVVSAVQFSILGSTLDYFVIHGPTPAEILRRFTALTGRPAMPPLWSFGLWLTTSFTTEYDEETVTHFVDGMDERGIPLSVFHFDTYWMRPLNWCDFAWDTDAFPDPEAMLARFAQRGLRTSAWINPYLGQHSPLFAEASAAGYLVRRPDGSVWQTDMWVAGMGLVDFTNPEAREWYAIKVRRLLGQGVDAIKADFGERIPTDVAWHDGSDPELMHNYYSLLYNRTVFEAVEAERGRGEAVLFARSATVGGQRYPVHWGGDCESTYAAMAESLRAGLSLGLSGFGFWSHDIGGFEGTPSAALFKRWLVFGLLSSHARLHGSSSYRVPWAFDDEAVDVARRFARLRNRLSPYLWATARTAHLDGIPVMRAMMLEFPADRTCAPLDRQYMLGPDLLVAPVFTDSGDVEYYVPDGRWRSYLDGAPVQGGRWHAERHDFESIPMLVRPGAVIVTGSRDDRPDHDHADHPTLEVFELADGAEATATILDQRGEPIVEFRIQRHGAELSASVVSGTDALTNGWTLTSVTGPLGAERGPTLTATPDQSTLRIPIE